MSTERDSHFAGFAKLLYEDFLQLAREDESSINEMLASDYPDKWRVKVEQLIARRAYDLVAHVVKIAPVTEWEWNISDIPDMDKWPE